MQHIGRQDRLHGQTIQTRLCTTQYTKQVGWQTIAPGGHSHPQHSSPSSKMTLAYATRCPVGNCAITARYAAVRPKIVPQRAATCSMRWHKLMESIVMQLHTVPSPWHQRDTVHTWMTADTSANAKVQNFSDRHAACARHTQFTAWHTRRAVAHDSPRPQHGYHKTAPD